MDEFLLFLLAFFCIVLCKAMLIEATDFTGIPDDFIPAKPEYEVDGKTIDEFPDYPHALEHDLKDCYRLPTYGISVKRDQEWKITNMYLGSRLLATFKAKNDPNANTHLFYRITKKETCDALELSYLRSKKKCVTLVIEKRHGYRQKDTIQGVKRDLSFFEKDWIWEMRKKGWCDTSGQTFTEGP
ncbi:uncharacterized protein LOC128995986 [Macrosteles quadrilineatus]|uniref:uncharacterized protein LOC128994038 n=1 Tax=Macrosteles quadrilineatus TaxID=74068 RepID=UPI0023E1B4DA|nr:uncharacterized protein LOC128994038 [Macrosteles quadrilineatus]XP_054277064.1 uncharacterized protein LOC128995986 [Macrosteles quadrilineatus]